MLHKKLFLVNYSADATTTSGRTCNTVARRFISDGGKVFFATAVGDCAIEGVEHFKIGNVASRLSHKICSFISDSAGFHAERATATLIDKILAIRPHIIHLHDLQGHYIHIPLLFEFLRKSDIPVVVTMYDCWLLTGHCLSPSASHCSRYQDGSCNDCPQRNRRPASWFDFSKRNIRIKRRLLETFDNLNIVTVNSHMASLVHESWLCHHPVFIIPNNPDPYFCNNNDDGRYTTLDYVLVIDTFDELPARSFITLRNKVDSHTGIIVMRSKNIPNIKNINNLHFVSDCSQSARKQLYCEAKAIVNISSFDYLSDEMIESIECNNNILFHGNSVLSKNYYNFAEYICINEIADAVNSNKNRETYRHLNHTKITTDDLCAILYENLL